MRQRMQWQTTGTRQQGEVVETGDLAVGVEAGSGSLNNNHHALCALSINVNSLKGPAKKALFSQLLLDHKPDLVFGCESKLSNEIADNEIFPPGFTVLRGDRDENGGGTFLLVKDTYRIDVLPPAPGVRPETIIGCKLLGLYNPVNLYSIYRPSKVDTTPLIEIQQQLDADLKPNHNIIMCGDFNAPDLDAACPSAPTKLLQNIAYEYSLEQMQTQPTRESSNLDLVYS